MREQLLQIFSPAALVLFFAGCEPHDSGADQPGAGSAEGPPTNRVDIPSTVRKNLGITFARVERRSVANTVRVPGAFELKPLARHEYRLLLPGRVEFAVDQFDPVEPGTVLYRFRSPQWRELQSRIDLAIAALDQARATFQVAAARVEALREADFKRSDLEARSAELKADVDQRGAELVAALNNAARILNIHNAEDSAGAASDQLLAPVRAGDGGTRFYQTIDSIEVRATEPGVVESLAVTNGAFVEATTLLLTTVDPTEVRFRALGMQSDLAAFERGRRVLIVPPRAGGGDINESVEGTLRIGLAADPDQRTITLYADPGERRPWIRPGVSAFLEVATESTGVVLAIPRSSVLKDGVQHVFFKRDPLDPNKAIRVEADLGVDDGRWVEIKSDVGPDDEVVLHGAYELKLATATDGAAQKGGHFHADGTYHGDH